MKRDRDGVRDGDWGKTVVVAPMLGGSHMWGPFWVNRANWIAVQQAELKMRLNLVNLKVSRAFIIFFKKISCFVVTFYIFIINIKYIGTFIIIFIIGHIDG